MATQYFNTSPLSPHFRAFIGRFLVLMLLLAGLSLTSAHGQGAKKVVQLTGVVTAGDSLLGIPGASVYIPKAGRGTNTNEYGFFSLPVLAGDSVVFSSIGYAKQSMVVPESFSRDSYSIIIEMLEDPTALPEVRVFPYATFRDFTQAVLAMKSPTEDIDRESAMSQQILDQMFRNTPMDANSNHRNYMDLQNQQQLRRGGYNPGLANPLLDPIKWYKVIKAIKNGDLKKE
ncbi:carboxypeptidase-like regulatory domain-containing protein [Rufibacter sediminis]|uniref:Carboxypeptidase-like regulatory domain-containing protein n=1 Tax=Rufibacter sediminis TaxID=2762756 RepID=A0ABR6VPU6_9BACT|nr:carboxypeptidase-like regulatory domain-containing protein [Rufibacter sediminis]MBC3539223.1 carboxypeptidase-like regulatory domain-containing protein [Rufibacter sediminis]